MAPANTGVLSYTNTEDISAVFNDVTKTSFSSLPHVFGAVIHKDEKKQGHALPQYRPTFHVMPSQGWLNDPCAPGYNAATKTYHLGFQRNPKGVVWGNMSWGSAISHDMVSWDVASKPSLEPSSIDDTCGVFTGTLLPTVNIEEPSETMTIFYTSAQKLPISYELPYYRTSEQVHMATSNDNGRSWQRHPNNPILSQPPPQYSVTGWRDPFISPWKSMDDILGDESEPCLYALVSGGIRERTPTVFLYRIRKNALQHWESLGLLTEVGLGFSPSKWTGDFGVNWEVANFLSFTNEHGQSRDFLIMGVEGVKLSNASRSKPALIASHKQKWLCGTLRNDNNAPKMSYKYGGNLDHGCFYAANAFWDPCIEQYVVFGWIMEEDLPLRLVKEQNWSGVTSIPRIVKLQTLKAVTGALKSRLDELTSFEVKSDHAGTYTVETISSIPDQRLSQLRNRSFSLAPVTIEAFSTALLRFPNDSCQQWELKAAFQNISALSRIGFDIAHTKGLTPIFCYRYYD
jgi:beta-fructofuranosidase